MERSSGNPPRAEAEPAWWFIFQSDQLIVQEGNASLSIPLMVDPASRGLVPIREKSLGVLDGHRCFRGEIAADSLIPPKMGLYGLRYLYEHLPEPLFALAMKASHLTAWEKATRYCTCCGREMAPVADLDAFQCTGCGTMVFPRISPAVIVLVEREGKILLARGQRFTASFYSVLAGFVEPGETLEDAVHREIEEEVGIKVKNIRYFDSQPWPFPDSLMIGFTAEYSSGEIRIDQTEIVDAGWFGPDELPTVPGKISIARRLIDWFVETRAQEAAQAKPLKERIYDPSE